jgi:AcrR family transcriptional regulator
MQISCALLRPSLSSPSSWPATKPATARPTIYSAFGSKAAILEEIRRLRITESGARESHVEALDEPEPAARLRMAAQWHRRQMELGYDVIAIYQEAARSDAAMAREWDRVQQSRESAVVQLVSSITPHLSARLDVRSATDRYVTLSLAEVYRTLVIDRRWSLSRYEA